MCVLCQMNPSLKNASQSEHENCSSEKEKDSLVKTSPMESDSDFLSVSDVDVHEDNCQKNGQSGGIAANSSSSDPIDVDVREDNFQMNGQAGGNVSNSMSTCLADVDVYKDNTQKRISSASRTESKTDKPAAPMSIQETGSQKPESSKPLDISQSVSLPEGVKDITGKRYGRLVALRFDHLDKKGNPIWLFQCDCGNQKLLPDSYVRYGKSKSCGCLRKEKLSTSHRSDIAGKRFGKLVAIEATDKRSQNGSVIWRCRCDCGNETFVSACKLRSGAVKSCGCLYKETRSSCYTGRKDLVDNTSVSDLVRSKTLRSDSSSGYTGVSWNKSTSRWVAYLSFQGKRHFLGSFLDKADAIKARKDAERQIHDPYIEEKGELLSHKSKNKFKDYVDSAKASRKLPQASSQTPQLQL